MQTARETGPFNENPRGLPDSVAIAACGTVVGLQPDSGLELRHADQHAGR